MTIVYMLILSPIQGPNIHTYMFVGNSITSYQLYTHGSSALVAQCPLILFSDFFFCFSFFFHYQVFFTDNIEVLFIKVIVLYAIQYASEWNCVLEIRRFLKRLCVHTISVFDVKCIHCILFFILVFLFHCNYYTQALFSSRALRKTKQKNNVSR